jgi:hypothetical protein
LIKEKNDIYIASIKKKLMKVFEMTYLEHLHNFLGIEIIQNPRYIFISNKKYTRALLNNFGMTKCNHVCTPMDQNLKLASKEGNEFEDANKYKQLVRSLIYLTRTRQDISFIIVILSKFMKKS